MDLKRGDTGNMLSNSIQVEKCELNMNHQKGMKKWKIKPLFRFQFCIPFLFLRENTPALKKDDLL